MFFFFIKHPLCEKYSGSGDTIVNMTYKGLFFWILHSNGTAIEQAIYLFIYLCIYVSTYLSGSSQFYKEK